MTRALYLLASLMSACAMGQNLAPNPSFEFGDFSPASWGGAPSAIWESSGYSGARSASVSGALGLGSYWLCAPPVQQGQAYLTRFRARGTNLSSGYSVAGFFSCSRDFPSPENGWQNYSYVAWIPSNGVPQFWLSSFGVAGQVFFDDVEILPLNAVHQRVGSCTLGDGESLAGGRYTFTPNFAGYAANYSRPLWHANASFNTSRWFLQTGTYVVYRHELAGLSLSNCRVGCAIQQGGNPVGGTVRVEASVDAQSWSLVGEMQATVATNFTVPPFPAPTTNLFIRLSTTNTVQLALTNYSFEADVSDALISGVGRSHYFGQMISGSNIQILEVTNSPEGKSVSLRIPAFSSSARNYEITAKTLSDFETQEHKLQAFLPQGESGVFTIPVPNGAFGHNVALLTVHDEAAGTNVFQQSLSLFASILADDSYGTNLPSPPDCPAWWCDGPYKVGLTRRLPAVTNVAVQISAARNEYEPFQVVLRPRTAMRDLTVQIGDFVHLDIPGAAITATNLTIHRVGYVPVTILDPKEAYSVTGEHPDPLVPITGPFDLPPGTNAPLWFTVHVPKNVPAGPYQSSISFQWQDGSFTVPVQLQIYDFALTDVTHTRTAYGLYLNYAWHGIKENPQRIEQERAVWELYLENMARHRISPFYPQWFNDISYSFDPTNRTFTHNFTRFDVAMERYLEEFNFNSFKDFHPYHNMPWLNGQPAYPNGALAINPEFRVLYSRLLQPVVQHLRERGWLPKAYSFWIDEPVAALNPLVRDGMLMMEEIAPDLPRVQSSLYAPDPELFDYVNVWWPCWGRGLKTQYIQPRKLAGDEVWFYTSAGAKAPWPNNFIDHPAINPRIRAWYAESLGLDGEAYYGINFYIGTTNPWTSPMTIDGYTLSGLPNYFGNGDGTLVYPPVKQHPTNFTLAGPIDSVRWEMLREGLEDREYFWLLNQAVARAKPVMGASHPAIIEAHNARAAALAMLPWPPAYPFSPKKISAARHRVARAIEALDDGSPFIAKDPLSKVARAGQSETLRVEAVGWPNPLLQWQHEGANIPGATNKQLVLSSLTTNQAGEYRVIASNSAGSVTSRVARLSMLRIHSQPVLISEPGSVLKTNGTWNTFGVGAASPAPLTYQWLHHGVPLVGQTNATLMLTNLTFVMHAGGYSVIVANSFGSVTSATASLSYPLSPELHARLLPSGALRIDLGVLYIPFDVQVSTDMSGWQTLTNLLPSTTNVTLMEQASPDTHRRFYRLASRPPKLQAKLDSAARLLITLDGLYFPAVMQVSTNLTDWQTATNLYPSASSIGFSTDILAESPHRFYRLLITQ